MPFSSYGFLFVFLPLALLSYHLVAHSRVPALRNVVLVLATLAFYGIAAARFLPLLVGSVAANFLVARAIARSRAGTRRALLVFGVLANLAALIGFKYTGFLIETIGAAAGLGWSAPHIMLPLAISFYTFQQIAFLVDTHRRVVKPDRAITFGASILFFPIIISGPISLYRELAPQLEARRSLRALPADLLVGLVILTLGLFKKTVIADGFALWIDPLYAQAEAGVPLGLLQAWAAAIGYLLQMYFDFSGYSDMAIGIARMFGILLPLNFFSPIRSTSIIEWWRRWHMTLGRWVNAYIFQPIALPLARWAAVRRLGRRSTLIVGTLAPTFLTMLIIGAWHGGNWTFFVFGALHGAYMVMAEAWRFARRKHRKGKTPRPWHLALGNALTLLAIFVAVVPFRAHDMATAARIWSAMGGSGALSVPVQGWPLAPGVSGTVLAWMITAAMAFAYLMPNSAQFMTRFSPALEWPNWRTQSPPAIRLVWRSAFAVPIGIMLFLGLALIGRGSVSFVYFAF